MNCDDRMEKKPDGEDLGKTVPESHVDGRGVGSDSLLRHNAKGLWIQQNPQRKNATPSSACFSMSKSVLSSIEDQSEKKADASTTGAVARAASAYLRPGDRRCLFSGKKKNPQRGPLKKRSPKLALSEQSKHSLRAPISTPGSVFRPPGLVGFHTGGSGFLSFGSITPASCMFRQRVTSSLVKNIQKRLPHELPVKRNLNSQLMAEADLTTPNTISTSGERRLLSNSTLQFSNSRRASSSTPLTVSFSKKRKLCNPVITNVSKINSASGFSSERLRNYETRGEQERRAPFIRIENQPHYATNTTLRPMPSVNILRITHPFGNSPFVAIRSRLRPIGSPLAAVSKTPSKKKARWDSNLNAMEATPKEKSIEEKTNSETGETTVLKQNLFSPIVRSREASNDSPRSSPVKSIATESRSRGRQLPLNLKARGKNVSILKKVLAEKRTQALFQDVRITTQPCKCKKTSCLKLYCECFHKASFCDPDLCHCIDCKNTKEFNSVEEPRGPRVLAILNILAKREDAFNGGRKYNTKGCGCTRG